jgi:hypothetical protein
MAKPKCCGSMAPEPGWDGAMRWGWGTSRRIVLSCAATAPALTRSTFAYSLRMFSPHLLTHFHPIEDNGSGA